MSSPLASPRPTSPLTVWLICAMAAIGFAFDIYELLMLPLIVRPALMELVNAAPGSPEFTMWVGRLFYIPAFAGGIFGLLGGYLTDRLGRRRVLTWSILMYAISAFLAGFSTSIEMLLFLRCTTFIGVCVEFVAAVAWLAELFADPHQRERVLGYTQAFSSVGGLLVAVANSLAIAWAMDLPAITLPDALSWLGTIEDAHAPWRYTLMSGLIPAIPLIIIRPFLPESPTWKAKKDAGTLKRASILELFQPRLRRTTIVTTIMFACSYGAAFGALQHIPRIVPGLPEVESKVSEMTVPAGKLYEQEMGAHYTKVQEVGGLCGRFLLALLVVRIVSRRRLLRLFLVPGLIVMPLVFIYPAVTNSTLLSIGSVSVTWLHVGIFAAGLLTVAQFSFWGNYLPVMYPVHLRGTGESFAANIGGRMFGTSFAWVTASLSATDLIPGSDPATKLAYTAAAVAFFVFLMGNIFCFLLPEPEKGAMDE